MRTASSSPSWAMTQAPARRSPPGPPAWSCPPPPRIVGATYQPRGRCAGRRSARHDAGAGLHRQRDVALHRSRCRSATSGPTTVAGSWGSPTTMFDAVSAAIATTSSYERRGTSTRVCAPHTCPERCMAPCTTRGTTAAMSASSSRMAADLPPSSRETRLTCVRRTGHDPLARGGRAGERHLVDAGVGDQVLAHLAAGRHHVEHPGGTPASSSTSARTKLLNGASGGGLEHHGAPGRQRGRRLPRRQGDRRVPGHDGRDHADRLAASPVPARSPETTVRSKSNVPGGRSSSRTAGRPGRSAPGGAWLTAQPISSVVTATMSASSRPAARPPAPACRPARSAPSEATAPRRRPGMRRPRPGPCRRAWPPGRTPPLPRSTGTPP